MKKTTGLANRLIALRTSHGIHQKDLALYLNVSIGTISNYEHGIHQPSLNTLCLLADYYGVSADYLLGRTPMLSEGKAYGKGVVSHVRRLKEFARRLQSKSHMNIASGKN